MGCRRGKATPQPWTSTCRRKSNDIAETLRPKDRETQRACPCTPFFSPPLPCFRAPGRRAGSEGAAKQQAARKKEERLEALFDAINDARIECARKLLVNSHLSVKEIAFESGYNDPVYFRRQFFRRTAMTPGEYRRCRSGGHINTE